MSTTDVPFQKNENGCISGQILKVTLFKKAETVLLRQPKYKFLSNQNA